MYNFIKILVHECVGSPFKYSQYNFAKKCIQNLYNISRNMMAFQMLFHFLTIILISSQLSPNAVFSKRGDKYLNLE